MCALQQAVGFSLHIPCRNPQACRRRITHLRTAIDGGMPCTPPSALKNRPINLHLPKYRLNLPLWDFCVIALRQDTSDVVLMVSHASQLITVHLQLLNDVFELVQWVHLLTSSFGGHFDFG